MKEEVEINNELSMSIPKGYEAIGINNDGTVKLVKSTVVSNYNDLGHIDGYYIATNNKIFYYSGFAGDITRNVFPTGELAKASLALSQLLQLKKYANDEPDWNEKCICAYGITTTRNNDIEAINCSAYKQTLTFKTKSIRDEFMKTHKDLLEQAKPLL